MNVTVIMEFRLSRLFAAGLLLWYYLENGCAVTSTGFDRCTTARHFSLTSLPYLSSDGLIFFVLFRVWILRAIYVA